MKKTIFLLMMALLLPVAACRKHHQPEPAISAITILEPATDGHDVYEENGSLVMTVGEKWQITLESTPPAEKTAFEYSIEPGGEEFLSVSENGEISAWKYSGKAAYHVYVKSKNGEVQEEIKISVWDAVTGLTLLGMPEDGVQDIGVGATQLYSIEAEPETAWLKEVSVSSPDGLVSCQVSYTDGKRILSVKSDIVDYSGISKENQTVSSTLTLQAGSPSAPFEKSYQFILTSFDPYELKRGDIISCIGNQMVIRDGGNRGKGIIRDVLRHYNTSNCLDVAIVGYAGNAHLIYDPALSTDSFTGPDKYETSIPNPMMEQMPSPLHGIAIPCNTTGLSRKVSVSDWSIREGEKWQGESDLASPSGFDRDRLILSADSQRNFCATAFYNTAALLKYSNSGSEKRDVRPIIYCSSEYMEDWLGVNSLRYSDFYYDGPNDDTIDALCPSINSTAPGRISYRWISALTKPKCSPWLLPTVGDLVYVFSGNFLSSPVSLTLGMEILSLEHSLSFTMGETVSLQNRSYWTSLQASADHAWSVRINADYVTHESADKTEVKSVLPVLYF